MRWPTPTARRWIWVPSPPSAASPAPIRSAARCRWWPTPTTSAADGRATVAAAMPSPRRPDAGQLLYAAGLLLCGVSYGTPLKDLRTPTGKIIIDENNWWQDFLNTVTFGLFFPTGAGFTIEAADDSVDHAGYDP